ncbi:quinone-dependent dihydroorotate dehydrogenase [Dawidia soli]|uniref:Dihydroorotate dehydrogenase (quinone) n=1 Tax=Dawidia soli TaxID=2782352 RepID=A0AAP2DDH2_9BACT|nr:quinone-dependent dihydroorotate dehydrogenase [Dawidia soli]MBT1689679.1 quinone-dependent dihydroorotate dehydrogenase [Dawidia soli]
MYKILIRPLLFLIDPERIHHMVFSVLQMKGRIPGFNRMLRAIFTIEDPTLERVLFGLRFKNPVGLAAGLDKDARLTDTMASLGFGFVEIGTLTPKPQPGNDAPRLFRLPQDQALINRMGFNNEGVAAAVQRLKARKSDVLIGGNIGKNKVTPNEEALNDYGYCFEALYPYVDYFVINVSSPNTPGLRELQEKEPLRKLLQYVIGLSRSKPAYKPVLLKIAPDLTQTQLDDIIAILQETNTDGVIATNTTISREGLCTASTEVAAIGNGGLSGKPLAKRATEVIAYLRNQLGKSFPIIGVGGIMSPEDAAEKLNAGADLVQVYTGFIYEGPSFAMKINKHLRKKALR